MKRRLGIAAGLATLLTLSINFVPDPGIKIFLALIFTIALGLGPALLKRTTQGIVNNLLLGLSVTLAVALANSLPAPIYPEQTLAMDVLKWIVPIAVYTINLSIPLLAYN